MPYTKESLTRQIEHADNNRKQSLVYAMMELQRLMNEEPGNTVENIEGHLKNVKGFELEIALLQRLLDKGM
jgi:hypothetical protein